MKKEAYPIIYRHFLLIGGLALIFLIWQGKQSGLSVALGGLAYWLPSFLSVWLMFGSAQHPLRGKQYLFLFALCEGMKLLVSAALFVVVAIYMPVKLSSVVIGFIGAVIAFWLAALATADKTREG